MSPIWAWARERFGLNLTVNRSGQPSLGTREKAMGRRDQQFSIVLHGSSGSNFIQDGLVGGFCLAFFGSFGSGKRLVSLSLHLLIWGWAAKPEPVVSDALFKEVKSYMKTGSFRFVPGSLVVLTIVMTNEVWAPVGKSTDIYIYIWEEILCSRPQLTDKF